jgi:hypothetical protein
VGLRAVLDRYEKSRPHWDSISEPSIPQRVDIPTITVHMSKVLHTNTFTFHLALHSTAKSW